jgi:thiamine pyrophosphate-dependent acetolactate synthase large subunit-like protein
MKQYCDGGEAILEAFRSLGIDYIVSSPGSEWSPMWEALARQKVNQKPGPRYIDCWHETLAVDIAIGYTQVTGMQAVLLHAGAGLLQGSACMHSALLAEVPMVILSGESLTFGEDPKLDIEPQWYRSLSIVGGPHRLVEPVTKWASQAASPHTLYEHVVRAGELAQRTPKGPVYLNVPLEVMLQEWTPPEHARKIPPMPRTRAKDADVERIAELLIDARNPIILTDSAGRDPETFNALIELADLFGTPVGGGRGASFANFPKNHGLHLGSGIEPFLKGADLVLLVSCKAPWYPPSRKPTTATIVSIDENPLKGTMVYQSLQADHYLSRARWRPRCTSSSRLPRRPGSASQCMRTGAPGGRTNTIVWSPLSAPPSPKRRTAPGSTRSCSSARCARRCRQTRFMSKRRSPMPGRCSNICPGPSRRASFGSAAVSGRDLAWRSASSWARQSARSQR